MTPSPLWKRLDGFTLPPGLNPALPPDAPLSPLLRRIEPQWLRDYDVAARSAARHSSSQAAACTSPLLATTSPPKR